MPVLKKKGEKLQSFWQCVVRISSLIFYQGFAIFDRNEERKKKRGLELGSGDLNSSLSLRNLKFHLPTPGDVML